MSCCKFPEIDCRNRACYGFVDGYATRCGLHKQANQMHYNLSIKCANCDNTKIISDECASCVGVKIRCHSTGRSIAHKGTKQQNFITNKRVNARPSVSNISASVILKLRRFVVGGKGVRLYFNLCAFIGCDNVIEDNKKYCYAHRYKTSRNYDRHKLFNAGLCKHVECKSYAHFGYSNVDNHNYVNTNACKYGIPIMCAIHKLDEMRRVSTNKCDNKFCDKTGSYISKARVNGRSRQIRTCKQHANKNHKPISNACSDKMCSTHGSYKIGSNVFCASHATNKNNPINRRLCVTPLCQVGGSRKYDGHCFNCYVQIYPDRPNARNYKTKEKHVVDHISKYFESCTMWLDKKIDGGCSLHRPDVMMDFGSHVVVIEIDENMHRQYDTSCENVRLMRMSQDLAHRPLSVVGFNPDSYRVYDGPNFEVIGSCFRMGKSGRLAVHKQSELDARLNVLTDTIRHIIDCPSMKTLDVVQLYYDTKK